MGKSKSKNILKLLLTPAKCLAVVLFAFMTIFFAACSTTESYDYLFDAEGRYRLNKIEASYYNKTSNGLQNQYTGSFLIPLEYYCDATYQDMSNLASSLGVIDGAFYRNFDQTGSKAFYHLVLSEQDPNYNGYKASGFVNVLKYPDYTISISGNLYQVHVSVDTSKLQIVMANGKTTASGETLFYGYDNYIAVASGSLSDVFHFAYRKGLSGDWKNADGFIKAVYLSRSQRDGQDFYDVTEDASQSYNNVFYMSFNPELERGTTVRKFRVKATPNMGQTIVYNSNSVTVDGSTYGLDTEEYSRYISMSLAQNEQVRGASEYSPIISLPSTLEAK